jgi:hypothetical protein
VFIAGLNGTVASAINAAIYEVTGGAGGGLDRIVAKGDTAGLGAGVAFKSFDAAANNADDWTAFTAKLAGTGVTMTNDSGVWVWNGTSVANVAREGGVAAESGGATWKGFASIALPDNGRPLFTAKLNASSATDTGLWALDSYGNVRLLVREGVTTIGGKTVKAFKVLENIAASPSQTRSHNGAGGVVYLATFTDGTQGIVKVQMP